MKRLRPLIPIMILVVLASVWWIRRDASAATDLASGTVEATEAHLGFQVAGRLAEIHFAEGDRVREGDLLARVDLAELEAVRAGAEASLAAATARLREMERGARRQETAQAEAASFAARERAAEAERERARAERLHAGGAISDQALQSATTASDVARAASTQADEALALVQEGPRREQLEMQRKGMAKIHPIRN